MQKKGGKIKQELNKMLKESEKSANDGKKTLTCIGSKVMAVAS